QEPRSPRRRRPRGVRGALAPPRARRAHPPAPGLRHRRLRQGPGSPPLPRLRSRRSPPRLGAPRGPDRPAPAPAPRLAGRPAPAGAAADTRYAADGTDGKPYATGLRNAVGLAFRPGTAELWATVNGRDWLGDDRPSEYVTRLEEGGFYGWPYCHWAGGTLMIDP